MSICIRNLFNESTLACRPIMFPGGEPHIHLDPKQIGGHIWIDARVTNAAEWMQLLTVIDAAKACRTKKLGLFLPYFPGARQDRRQPGFAFTLKLYADMLRPFGLDAVVVLDPHSDVLAGLLPIEVVPLVVPISARDGIICPDAGGERRAYATARQIGAPVIHARKHRDSATGKLDGFSCDPLPKVGRYLMVDDICDGGGTFVGLMEAIRADENFPGSTFELCVSHGIFSKGLDALLGCFSKIHTTDSWPQPENPKLRITDLLPIVTPIIQRAIAP